MSNKFKVTINNNNIDCRLKIPRTVSLQKFGRKVYAYIEIKLDNIQTGVNQVTIKWPSEIFTQIINPTNLLFELDDQLIVQHTVSVDTTETTTNHIISLTNTANILRIYIFSDIRSTLSNIVNSYLGKVEYGNQFYMYSTPISVLINYLKKCKNENELFTLIYAKPYQISRNRIINNMYFNFITSKQNQTPIDIIKSIFFNFITSKQQSETFNSNHNLYNLLYSNANGMTFDYKHDLYAFTGSNPFNFKLPAEIDNSIIDWFFEDLVSDDNITFDHILNYKELKKIKPKSIETESYLFNPVNNNNNIYDFNLNNNTYILNVSKLLLNLYELSDIKLDSDTYVYNTRYAHDFHIIHPSIREYTHDSFYTDITFDGNSDLFDFINDNIGKDELIISELYLYTSINSKRLDYLHSVAFLNNIYCLSCITNYSTNIDNEHLSEETNCSSINTSLTKDFVLPMVILPNDLYFYIDTIDGNIVFDLLDEQTLLPRMFKHIEQDCYNYNLVKSINTINDFNDVNTTSILISNNNSHIDKEIDNEYETFINNVALNAKEYQLPIMPESINDIWFYLDIINDNKLMFDLLDYNVSETLHNELNLLLYKNLEYYTYQNITSKPNDYCTIYINSNSFNIINNMDTLYLQNNITLEGSLISKSICGLKQISSLVVGRRFYWDVIQEDFMFNPIYDFSFMM